MSQGQHVSEEVVWELLQQDNRVEHCLFFFSSRRRHTRFDCDWSSDVCSSDLDGVDNRPTSTDKIKSVRLTARHDFHGPISSLHFGTQYQVRDKTLQELEFDLDRKSVV